MFAVTQHTQLCQQQWQSLLIQKNIPKVIKCIGADDILWLNYQVHLVKEYKDKLSGLNDEFAIIVTHGNECDNPSKSLNEAKTQIDCYNYEEGKKCIRKNIAINTFGSNQSCFIIYCVNYKSNCHIWVRSYWTKYVMVYESHQSIEIGQSSIHINGENFASNKDLIKIKCIDSHNRILQCNIKWVNIKTGKEAIIDFDEPFKDKNTGKIFIRLDSDNIGWTKPVLVGIVINEINPYISSLILNSYFIFGLIVVIIFCFFNYLKRKRGF